MLRVKLLSFPAFACKLSANSHKEASLALLIQSFPYRRQGVCYNEGVDKRRKWGQKRGDSSLLTWERVGGDALKTNIVMAYTNRSSHNF